MPTRHPPNTNADRRTPIADRRELPIAERRRSPIVERRSPI
jgi:hypothetical protein